nr:amidohydrolase family protein [Corynebacterium occultum]
MSFDESGILSIEELDPAAAPPEQPTIIPGFVDLHNHGGKGGSFPTGSLADCRRAAEYHRSQGTTTMLASLVSGNERELTHQVERLKELVGEGLIHGIHLEGPFINAARCGAQSPDRIQPGDPEMFRRIIEAGQGNIRQITLAPETEHVGELLEICARFGIIAGFGHTEADYDTTLAALGKAAELGVRTTATHLFNAMPQIHHRTPGAAAALLSAGGTATGLELIADGVHLAAGTVDLVFALAGERAYAVTDAMEATGLPDGSYQLGPLEVVLKGGVARLATAQGSGALAGGTSTLARQFHHFRRRHDGPAAVRFTATNAAAVLDLVGEVGDLRPGLRANLVQLNPQGEVERVYMESMLWEGSHSTS